MKAIKAIVLIYVAVMVLSLIAGVSPGMLRLWGAGAVASPYEPAVSA